MTTALESLLEAGLDDSGTGIAVDATELTLTSAQVRAIVSDESGTGALQFADGNPGTPTAIVLTNATGTATGLTAGNATLAATVTVADAASDATTWPMLATSQTGSLAPATDAGLSYSALTNSLTTSYFVGALNGTADKADTVVVVDVSGDTTTWVMLARSQSGTSVIGSDAGLTYDATTNALTATTFVGALTGTASGVVTNANLTGPVTSIGNATSVIATNSANVAFGYQAGLVDAGGNTNFGYQAGKAVTSGIHNTAVGAETLKANIQGEFNTAMGERALVSAGATGGSAASSNTAYGYASGESLTTGASNTLLGKLAGSNITTGSGNLIVGTVNASGATAANEANIGDWIKGKLDTGAIELMHTNTAGGTTGAQTINKPSGAVNFAGGATTLVVTNSVCATTSLVFVTLRTADATAVLNNKVVPGAGSFTITMSVAPTAETSVGFFVIN